MALLHDAKQYFRELARALEIALDRLDRLDATRQLLVSSQLIGSTDSLAALLMFFGDKVKGMRKFSDGGRRKLAEIRSEARQIRKEAYRELLHEEPPPLPDDEPSTDEQEPPGETPPPADVETAPRAE